MNDPTTLRQLICNSYARLTMMDAAIHARKTSYDRACYGIRERMYHGLLKGTLHISDGMSDNAEKMRSTKSQCYYCGCQVEPQKLTIEHIIPRAEGGSNSADNILLVCKTCNSSKGDMDLMRWYLEVKCQFPSVFILRQYLRLIYNYASTNGILDVSLQELDQKQLPFDWHYIPIHNYPQLPQQYD